MFSKEKLFPELLMFPDAKSRKAAWKAAIKSRQAQIPAWALVVGNPVILVTFKEFVFPRFNLPYIAKLAIYVLIMTLTMRYFIFTWRRRNIEQLLREQLREEGIMVCMHCAYDLRGCTGPVCPECGNSREQGGDVQ